MRVARMLPFGGGVCTRFGTMSGWSPAAFTGVVNGRLPANGRLLGVNLPRLRGAMS